MMRRPLPTEPVALPKSCSDPLVATKPVSAPPAATTTTIASVTHKRVVPIFDQGNLGSCTGITPSLNTYGWGLRLTGYIKLPEVGNHTFRVASDDGATLSVDDTLLTTDWTNGSYRTHPNNTAANGIFYNPVANSWHRIPN